MSSDRVAANTGAGAGAGADNEPANMLGAVTLLVINLSNTTSATLDVSFPDNDLSAEDVLDLPRQEYVFTSAGGSDIPSMLRSHSVLLNGGLLSSIDGEIPPLPPNFVPANSGAPVQFPPLSYGFIVFPTVGAGACPDFITPPVTAPAEAATKTFDWKPLAISCAVVILLGLGVLLMCVYRGQKSHVKQPTSISAATYEKLINSGEELGRNELSEGKSDEGDATDSRI